MPSPHHSVYCVNWRCAEMAEPVVSLFHRDLAYVDTRNLCRMWDQILPLEGAFWRGSYAIMSYVMDSSSLAVRSHPDGTSDCNPVILNPSIPTAFSILKVKSQD